MSIKPIFAIVVFSILFSFLSCSSKEENVVNQLYALAERIEEEGETFTEKDWNEAWEEFEVIHEEMEDCNFTREEIQEIGRIEGKLFVVFIKKLGRDIIDFGFYVNGFASGIKEKIEDNE